MKNNEQACDAQPPRDAIANQLSRVQQAVTTVSIANYVINTAAIGILSSKTTISQALLPLPRGEGWGEGLAGAQSLGTPNASLKDVYLRPTAGYSPCKFFENTRDGKSSELKAVSTRLPKNFQCKHPALSAYCGRASLEHTVAVSSFPRGLETSASLAISRADNTNATGSVANYVINTEAISTFDNKTASEDRSEPALSTEASESLQTLSNTQPQQSRSTEIPAAFTSSPTRAGKHLERSQTARPTELRANCVINTAAVGVFFSRAASQGRSEAAFTETAVKTLESSLTAQPAHLRVSQWHTKFANSQARPSTAMKLGVNNAF